jgi:two-component sensor histidine kinase
MERLLRALPARPQPAGIRLGITTLVVALCFVILVGLHRQSDIYWFFVLYPAVFVASVLFDRGSGFVATALSAAFLYLLLKPDDGPWLAREYAVPIAMFVVIAAALAAISDGLRVGWERAVTAEKTKDLLLHELGHRIRNNLAMAISVLLLQARAETRAEVKAALEHAAARIRAIAAAHDHLDLAGHDGHIQMRDYLVKLCSHIRDHLGHVRPIAIDVAAEDAGLRAEDAIAVGLIANELVTNALKHAFPDGRSGSVQLAFSVGPPLQLTVEDDGVGCPPMELNGLGTRLLHLLVRQIRGTIAWEEARPGCRVRVTAVPPDAGRLAAAARGSWLGSRPRG